MSRDTEIDSAIRFAIEHRRLVRLTYHDVARLVEPHDYGVINGQAGLLAYQRQGRPGARPEWRHFHLHDITNFTVLDEEFAGSRNQPGQAHKQWDELFCRVS